MGSADLRLEALFRRYGPVIYNRCRTLLRDPAAAQDATQETFLRVRKHLEQVPDTEQALHYIYRVATNYCLNELRDRKGRPEPVETVPEQAQLGFEACVADRDLANRVLASVPAYLRAPAYLHYVDGLEQSEVAMVLKVSRRTVVSRLTEFQNRIRILFGGSDS